MNTELVLKKAGDLLATLVIESGTPESNRLDIVIDPENLLPAIQQLVSEHWGYLAAITGLDPGTQSEWMEVLYHFCTGAAVLTLRVRTPRDHPAVSSISNILPAASFYERELREMMGVELVNLVNQDHLFLPDDWPDKVYPLRKDAELE